MMHAFVAVEFDFAYLCLFDVHTGLEAIYDVCGHKSLAIDHLKDFIINCSGAKHIVYVYGVFLTDTMSPVLSLV